MHQCNRLGRSNLADELADNLSRADSVDRAVGDLFARMAPQELSKHLTFRNICSLRAQHRLTHAILSPARSYSVLVLNPMNLSILALLLAAPTALGHGYLNVPAARNVVMNSDYCKQCLAAGGPGTVCVFHVVSPWCWPTNLSWNHLALKRTH